MSLSDAKHPVWKLARLIVVCVTMLVFFGTIYKQPIELKDLITIIGTIAALAGYDFTKTAVTK